MTTEEIENVEHFPSIFLSPKLNRWDTYDESFASNEDSYLKSRGDMVILPNCPRHAIVEEADLSAVGTSCDRQHEMDNYIDSIIDSSHIATIADNAGSDEELTKDRIKLKSDLIRAQVANVSSVLDSEVLCDLLYEQITLSKFSGALSSITTSNPQDPDYNLEVLDYELFLED